MGGISNSQCGFCKGGGRGENRKAIGFQKVKLEPTRAQREDPLKAQGSHCDSREELRGAGPERKSCF